MSGLTSQAKQIPLPRKRLDRIRISALINVTDAVTAANENFEGAITKLKIGEGNNLPVDVERDELSILIDLMTEGLTTGKVIQADLAADNDPVVADETRYVTYDLIGPFQLRGMQKPVLDITVNPGGEWASATVFTGTLTVSIEESKPNDQTKPGFYFHREYRGADIRHELPLGPSVCTEIGLILGASGMTKAVLPAEWKGKSSTSKLDVNVDTDNAHSLLEEYAARKRSVVVTGRYLFPDLRTNNYSGRQLVVDTSSTTALMFARNLVQ
jgi:hypothetical protein